MTKVTISAKVPPEVIKTMSETGYLTSDILLVGLDIFLNLSPDQQSTLMWDLIRSKKKMRAIERSRSKRENSTEVD
ncbi:MAG: hypothetical protein ACYC21_12410 [Eubacteriales bacterium]